MATFIPMEWKWRLAQRAEIRWWMAYLSKQSPEAYLRQKRAYWLRVMQQAEIRIRPGSRILDMGCGPAGIFTVLPEAEVWAVDPLLDRYADRLPHFATTAYPNVHFVTRRLEDFVAERPFEQVFCLNAINHVSDIRKSMERLVACMAPAATLWLSVDAHRFGFLRRLFRWIPADILHPHQYTLSGYEELLREAGLVVRRRIRLKHGRIFDYYLLETAIPA